MRYQDRWLLPAGITEILPVEAARLEKLRRQLIDLYTSWGYELVIPPMLEYLESLLVGTGQALELQTFKLTDQLTGRTMGIRADMTPQVARIDALHLKREVPTRLCYLGTVLHTRPNKFAGSRSPYQVGAELYGHAGIESDAEIISLMSTTLKASGIDDFHLDVGHMGIYRHLVHSAQLNPQQESQLYDAVKRKAVTEIESFLSTWQVPRVIADMLSELMQLNGTAEVLGEARHVLRQSAAEVQAGLDDLEGLQTQLPGVTLHFDLAELRGYSYHTGIIFAAYLPRQGQAIAKGGRYDGIAKVFGSARPATGFSTNLRALVSLASSTPVPRNAIFAPPLTDAQLLAAIAELRQQGRTVICGLPNQQGDAQAMGCDYELRRQEGTWQVVPLNLET